MKFLKLAVAAAVAFASANAYAFHGGGVAACESCHVMHNAVGGTAKSTHAADATFGMNAAVPGSFSGTTAPYLLQGSDQSSTCLMCHAKGIGGYHVADLSATAQAAGGNPGNYSPGGDFGYLKKVYGTTNMNRFGHNIVAADFNLGADANLTVAPGGSFQVKSGIQGLGCQSCHDPHGRFRIQANPVTAITAPLTSWNTFTAGKILPISASGSYGALPTATTAVGVYRILGGNGYAIRSNAFTFTADPPIAVAPSTYNQNESTNEVRVAYGSGMSEWCANCHGGIHNDSYPTTLRHPAGNGAKLTATIASIYNAYLSSGDLSATGGSAYTSLVPFETGSNDLAALLGAASNLKPLGTLETGTSILQASTSANVACISCHRVHGSGFSSIGRWNFAAQYVASTTMALSYGRTAAEEVNALYGRNLGSGVQPYQRNMCNKCHAKV